MKRPTSILVTGCAGFIGSQFVKGVKKMFPDYEILGVDDFSTGRRSRLDNSISFYEGSILDESLVNKIFVKHEPKFVFHFAALPRVSFSIEKPRLTTDVNITGTVTLLEAARLHGVERFIYSSSSSIYGGAKKFPTKELENLPNPQSPYAIQKYTGEPFCRVYSSLYPLDTVCLRYFNVFGPGQYGDSPYSSVISAWLEALYVPSQQHPYIEGDGRQTRDFCFIDNVVNANILAMQSEVRFGGEAINIAHGERTSVNEVKKMIEKHTGKGLELMRKPPRPGDVRDSYADITRAEKLLGYKPTVKFEEGLQKTISWFETRAKEASK